MHTFSKKLFVNFQVFGLFLSLILFFQDKNAEAINRSPGEARSCNQFVDEHQASRQKRDLVRSLSPFTSESASEAFNGIFSEVKITSPQTNGDQGTLQWDDIHQVIYKWLVNAAFVQTVAETEKQYLTPVAQERYATSLQHIFYSGGTLRALNGHLSIYIVRHTDAQIWGVELTRYVPMNELPGEMLSSFVQDTVPTASLKDLAVYFVSEVLVQRQSDGSFLIRQRSDRALLGDTRWTSRFDQEKRAEVLIPFESKSSWGIFPLLVYFEQYPDRFKINSNKSIYPFDRFSSEATNINKDNIQEFYKYLLNPERQAHVVLLSAYDVVKRSKYNKTYPISPDTLARQLLGLAQVFYLDKDLSGLEGEIFIRNKGIESDFPDDGFGKIYLFDSQMDSDEQLKKESISALNHHHLRVFENNINPEQHEAAVKFKKYLSVRWLTAYLNKERKLQREVNAVRTSPLTFRELKMLLGKARPIKKSKKLGKKKDVFEEVR